MGTHDTEHAASGVSRRDFLKAAAATAVAGCAFEFAFDPEKALAYEDNPDYQVRFTTCPYCSASCGQRVVVDVKVGSPTEGKVVDIYGDYESPLNSGGLCAKGAGAKQLVTNSRRIGAWATSPHPTGKAAFVAKPATTAFSAVPTGWTGAAYTPASYTYAGGVAYFRSGNNAWAPVPLDVAMADIASKMTTARGALGANVNSKKVAFFGSSHMNNESNYLYRKLIANFGTSNTEHQARI